MFRKKKDLEKSTLILVSIALFFLVLANAHADDSYDDVYKWIYGERLSSHTLNTRWSHASNRIYNLEVAFPTSTYSYSSFFLLSDTETITGQTTFMRLIKVSSSAWITGNLDVDGIGYLGSLDLGTNALSDTNLGYFLGWRTAGHLAYMDGEDIWDDTIDNDSIDWNDMTDLTTDGALDADVVDEAHIADNGIDSEHYNDGSIDAIHLAADIIDETKIADNGIDSEHYNDDSIDDDHINWGVGTDQVSGADIPVLDSIQTVDTFLTEVIPSGILDTITVSDDGGVNFSWSSGSVHVNGVVIITDSGSAVAVDNDRTYLYATITGDVTLSTSTIYPTGDYALIATIDAYDGDIEHYWQRDTVGEYHEDIETHLSLVHTAIIANGLLVAADTNGTNANDFTIASGIYYHEGLNKHAISSTLYSAGSGHGDDDTNLYYHVGSTWTQSSSNGVDFARWDDGTSTTTTSASKWYCAWIFLVDTDIIEYVYPQNEHANEQAALQEVITYPPYHTNFAVPLAKFIFRHGESAFGVRAYFADIRPVHIKGVAGEIVYAVQDLWKTIEGDSGSTDANLTYDVLTIAGGTHLTSVMSGDTLTMNADSTLATDAEVATSTTNVVIGILASTQTWTGQNTFNNNMVIISSVGIGTSSPDTAFHIKAGIAGLIGSHAAGQLIIQNPADSVFSNVAITAYESDGSGNPDQQLWYLGSASIGNSEITFLNRRNSKLHLGTSGNSRITILGNGNVGINDATPSYKLDVNGGGRFVSSCTASAFYGDGKGLTYTGQTAGDLLYYDGSSWIKLSSGTSGQYLKAGTAPTYDTPAGAGDTQKAVDETITGHWTFSGTSTTFNNIVAAGRVAVSSSMGEGTPVANTLYKDNIIKGFVNYDGVGDAIRGSFNVSGMVTDNTGKYTVSWDVDFADANYTVVGCTEGSESVMFQSPLVGSASPWVREGGAYTDDNYVWVIAIGNQ